ncbi:putative short-chain dehydrogenases/reductase [Apodospora peruviana]|uniref:Short-chain dehydrogenases/reductase n=1 Tax=Apodospora peruviana TaxID=516989 RepID=A0AAE0HUC7_9PEZI|nr:putative short-chain dehydrogenases/reductase [Apodospora peruviana]
MSSYAITGTSRGLGLEFVRQLSQSPNNTVFAIARNPDSATKLQDLASQRPNLHVIKADITDPQSLSSAAASISKITNGTLDVLINNAVSTNQAAAPVPPSQIPLDVTATTEFFRVAYESSLFGAIWTTNAFLPLIEAGKDKKIVHISTAMADQHLIKNTGISLTVDYAVAKGAMNVLVAKYAAELAPKGIKVVALSPGWVDTFEGPKPAEYEGFVEYLLNSFRKIWPDLKGQIVPEESVRMVLEVVDGLSEEQSGLMISHHGNEDWI